MTASARPELLVRETMRLVDALAHGPAGAEPPPAFAPEEWCAWYALVEAHGLAPGLSRLWEGSRWSALPPELAVRCRREYTTQTVRRLAALRQFHDIRDTLDTAGIPVLPLKGLAFSRTLYADPAQRQFGDLDLLVPEAAGSHAVALLKEQGYTPLPAFTSPEEELLHARQAHFCPLVRPGALPVELHTHVLKDRGDAPRARDDAWTSARPDEHGTLQLDPTHATLLAAAHYAGHLRLGAGHLKWLVDLLLLLRGDPSSAAAALRTTAGHWNLLETVAPLLATAATFPGCPPLYLPTEAQTQRTGSGVALTPIPAEVLVFSPQNAGSHALASAASRLARLHELPNPAARARYLARLLFPSSEHLRYRYQVPAEHSIQAHRIMHPLRLAARLFTSGRGRRRVTVRARTRLRGPDNAT